MRALPIPSDDLQQQAQHWGTASGEACARREGDKLVQVREEFRSWLKELSVTREVKDELDAIFAKAHRRASGQSV